MVQKKMYKVLTPIQKHDGTGSWFMKIGSGFTNKDDSINLYVDVIPVGIAPGKGMTLQIRELDENDLRQREASRGRRPPAATAITSRTSRGCYARWQLRIRWCARTPSA